MFQCVRCGYAEDLAFLERRKERRQEILCRSCLARPVREIKSNFGICRPHRGDFDYNDNPLDRWGKLFRPGVRLCGNRDCIEPTHIVNESDLKG